MPRRLRAQIHGHPEMTSAELARCRPAADTEAGSLPIPTHTVSNEEYFPPTVQTEHQARVEARVLALADELPARLGLSRRQFLRTSAGLAASFAAINEVFAPHAYGAELFAVGPDAIGDHDAFLADGPPKDLFVFDDQCHFVRGQAPTSGIPPFLRAIAQGESTRTPNSLFLSNPWNPLNLPDEHGEPWANWNPDLIGKTTFDATEFWLPEFLRYFYFESQTSVALISTVAWGHIPSAVASTYGVDVPGITRNVAESRPHELITAEQTFQARELINAMSGSTRAMSHGLMYMGPGNLWYLREQLDRYGVDSWKGYQNANAKRDDGANTFFEYWRLDDEQLAFPTFEWIRDAAAARRRSKPGLNNVAIHKGLGTSADPSDIPAAAEAFPELNFLIYHSCIRPAFFNYDALADVHSGRLREGVPDIKDVTEFAQTAAPYPNVYAEIGTTFASCVVTFPTVCAHVLGILFKYLGADRILWGTDSVWYGSPQWQIEAFWRFRMPEEFTARFGYPEITPDMKRTVLGLNSARLYRMSPEARQPPLPADYRERVLRNPELMRVLEYADRLPSDQPYGIAAPDRDDALARAKAAYRHDVETRYGIPRDNTRSGWIRTR
ncbi:MAG: amidohydrolase family protein [Sporichthyaceae bacterium]